MKIHTLDLLFQGVSHAIAAYLVIGPEGPALVETGPGSTLSTLVGRLADHGYAPKDLQHVLVTHIHLDHAGAAGWWARQGATIHVHPRGAPHLVDPSKLLDSATRIYGEAMDRLWGEVLSAPADRVVEAPDQAVVEAGGLRFTALETPGHASHHVVWRVGEVGFAGDAAGIRLPGTAWVDLPAPPPEFDLETWLQTLARLRKEGFAKLYPTHFGAVDDVGGQLDALEALLEETTEWIRRGVEAGMDRPGLVRSYLAWVTERSHAHGVPPEVVRRYELANPRDMSVDGIVRYWRKRAG